MVGDVYLKGVSQMAIGSNLCIFTHLSHLQFIHLGYKTMLLFVEKHKGKC